MAYPPIGIAYINENGAAAIEVAVPDIASAVARYGATGIIRIQSTSTDPPTGGFANLTTIALVGGQTFYETTTSTSGAAVWYRYRFENAGGSTVSAWSDGFPSRPAGSGNHTFGLCRQETARELGMYASGTTTGAGSTTTVVCSAFINAIATANRWKGGWLKLTSGDASGQARNISDYATGTGVFTVTPALSQGSGSGNTFELYRDISPAEIDEAINDVLQLLPVEDEYRFACEANRTHYPLPFWVTGRAGILGLDRLTSWGATTGERENERWEPASAETWEVRRAGNLVEDVTGHWQLVFALPQGANQVFRVRLLRPYIAAHDLRISSDATVVGLPLHDVVVGAKFQALDRLVNAAPPNAKSGEWEKRRNGARLAWHRVLAHYYQRSTPLREHGRKVTAIW